jgi:hypothetical protein
MSKCLQESFLGQILGVLSVASEVKGDVVGFVFVALDQFLERTAIATARERHQLRIPGVQG